MFFSLCLVICLFVVVVFIQSGFTVQIVNEGDEPENFFWVGIGGRKDYDKVPAFVMFMLFRKLLIIKTIFPI